jgi:hypothetical protein
VKPQALNPNLYRAVGGGLVPRSRLEQMLDAGLIEVKMSSVRWWRIRRNGRTQTWKSDANRIRIPIKAGLKNCGAITETDFIEV